MARPNRFQPRNQVQDLQRRQGDGLGSPAAATPAPEITWNDFVQPVRGLNTGGWGDLTEYLNQTITATTALPEGLYNTTANTIGANTWRTTLRDPIIREPRGEVRIQPVRRPDRREDIWAINDVVNNDFITPAEREIFRRAHQAEARTEAQVQERANRWAAPAGAYTGTRRPLSQESLNYRTGKASQKKAEARKNLFGLVMATGRAYAGKLFKYEVNSLGRIGTWKVGEHSVAEVDLDTVTLVSITMPKAVGDKLIDNTLFNRTRFLWRLLGLEAVRYKDKTVVHTGVTGNVILAGETWKVPIGSMESYVQDPDSPSTTTQGILFESHTSLPTLNRTKPTVWVNLDGKSFLWSETKLPDGTAFNLNAPPELTTTDS